MRRLAIIVAFLVVVSVLLVKLLWGQAINPAKIVVLVFAGIGLGKQVFKPQA
ncbi:hypothetical protein HMPREF1557_02214 [Streptococcus sobrinus W1703]|uniref:Uncharacterized protein n=1 Tax=Streptococcus sobrinus W1703 TaxID=1227275 RepID=U2J0S2_9STRE|nr:hypothetical protein HMPREF1557_02214 [Streptococcus sobrinus W1703]